MLENSYQSKLIKRLKKTFPGCIVLKNDADYIQGIPDLMVLYKDRWATLECKKSIKAKHQPNQDYYVEQMNKMSYSSFIFPENEEQVFKDLVKVFR